MALIQQFFKGCFGVKAMLASGVKERQKALQHNVIFPHLKAQWK